jgi:hypothetical protein
MSSINLIEDFIVKKTPLPFVFSIDLIDAQNQYWTMSSINFKRRPQVNESRDCQFGPSGRENEQVPGGFPRESA